MMQQKLLLFVTFAAVMSVMVQLCSPASVLQPETSNIKKKAAKQQQSTSNNFAYALQDHRVGGRHGLPSQPEADQPLQGELANLSEVEPIQLRYCFRAIQFIQKTASHVQEVQDITNDEQLPIIIADVSSAAQKAFIFSEIAIGLAGDPVTEAVLATRNATITARNASNVALKVATDYSSTKPGAESSHKAVQAAQQSTLTAQNAQHQILQAGYGQLQA
ncbi:uncharacterized protein LOC142330991 isoform X3 [Lycorma delicatula]|uniref:uncharacterized protein LOC142330991 isoform X3 n=1 Tax=Lycorma delicatula TaxID=130591 RepID=UPI003F5194C8